MGKIGRTIRIVAIVLLLNSIMIFFNVKSGLVKGDAMLRFREGEAVTFLSALMLGLTSMVSLIIFLLKRKVYPVIKGFTFWLLSCFGFFYLCMVH